MEKILLGEDEQNKTNNISSFFVYIISVLFFIAFHLLTILGNHKGNEVNLGIVFDEF